MTRFSKKELNLLEAFYLRQEKALTQGLKVKKAALYREIYEKPNMKSQTANTAFNLILQRFKLLPLKEQDEYFKKWEIKAKEEEIQKKVNVLEKLEVYNKAIEENNKKFNNGFVEGKKAGKQMIQQMVSSVDFWTEEGQINFLEGIATLFLADYQSLAKISYFDNENNKYVSNAPILASIIKELSNIATLNFQRLQKSPEYLQKMLDFKKRVETEIKN